MKKTFAKKSLRLDPQTVRRLDGQQLPDAAGGALARSILKDTGTPLSCAANVGCGYQVQATFVLMCH